jgi:hypothetical protein
VATVLSFTLADNIAGLQQQRRDIETALATETDSYQKAVLRNNLERVNVKIGQACGNGKFKDIVSVPKAPKVPAKKNTREIYPWEWPGPIALAGMKAVPAEGGTFTHITHTDPEYQGEVVTREDYKKVVAWAESMGWSAHIVAAHLGAIAGSGAGRLYTKTNLSALQDRIAKISAERFKTGTNPIEEINIKIKETPKVGIFNAKKGSATTALKEAAEAQKQAEIPADLPIKIDSVDLKQTDATTVASPWAAQERQDAVDRLVQAGMTIYKVVETREQAEEILKHRSMAILELGLIMEQYEKAKTELENIVKDISLVFDPALEKFMRENNKTGKKTWSLLHGDLKVMNKAESVKLDEKNDMDGSLFQAWLKTQYDKKTDVVAAAEIVELKKYGRDMKKFADWYKAQPKKPSVPGISYTPARTDVFSISPSLDTAKDKIKEAMKAKGLR